jgi:hypothetical protein
MFGPRHTLQSTATLLAEGLENGSIVLDGEEKSVKAPRLPASVARWEVPQWLAFVVGGLLGSLVMGLLEEVAPRHASRLAELMLGAALGMLTGFVAWFCARLLAAVIDRPGPGTIGPDRARSPHP